MSEKIKLNEQMNERNEYALIGRSNRRMQRGNMNIWGVVGERGERQGGINIPPNHPGSAANLQAKAQWKSCQPMRKSLTFWFNQS